MLNKRENKFTSSIKSTLSHFMWKTAFRTSKNMKICLLYLLQSYIATGKAHNYIEMLIQ